MYNLFTYISELLLIYLHVIICQEPATTALFSLSNTTKWLTITKWSTTTKWLTTTKSFIIKKQQQ